MIEVSAISVDVTRRHLHALETALMSDMFCGDILQNFRISDAGVA